MPSSQIRAASIPTKRIHGILTLCVEGDQHDVRSRLAFAFVRIPSTLDQAKLRMITEEFRDFRV